MASGKPKAVCAIQIPRYVFESVPIIWAISLYMRSNGINDICNGTTSNATTTTNSHLRPGKFIQLNAYAAKAAIRIGMNVAGIVTLNVLRNACPTPTAPITF